jgi:hypothetical protein
VFRTHRELIALVVVAGCGWLPPDSPPKAPVQPDPDIVELVHDWKIGDHVLAMSTAMSDRDARELHGRTVGIRASGYTSPWHGTCDDAARERRKVSLVEVAADLDVGAPGREAAHRFGIANDPIEYRLSCHGSTRIPPITVYITGTHAMTCFNGVCYLMTR